MTTGRRTKTNASGAGNGAPAGRRRLEEIEVDIDHVDQLEDGAAEGAPEEDGVPPMPEGVEDAAGTPEASDRAPICSVTFCPICTAVSLVGELRPELMDHLLLAGREMLLAARALIDARLETTEPGSAEPRMEHIPIEG
jgi:hypothetical protein